MTLFRPGQVLPLPRSTGVRLQRLANGWMWRSCCGHVKPFQLLLCWCFNLVYCIPWLHFCAYAHLYSMHTYLDAVVLTQRYYYSWHSSTMTFEVSHISECLALTQNKQRSHVQPTQLSTKDVFLAVQHNALLINTQHVVVPGRWEAWAFLFVFTCQWNFTVDFHS